LLYRGVRGDRKGWRWTWGIAAFFCAAGYSVLDEIHQAFIASRTASAYDSLLDSIGALFAFAVLWLWFRFRGQSATLNSQNRPVKLLWGCVHCWYSTLRECHTD